MECITFSVVVSQHGGVRGSVHQNGDHGEREVPLSGQRPAPEEPVNPTLKAVNTSVYRPRASLWFPCDKAPFVSCV